MVIERNLGNIERVIRLLLGLLFLGWVLTRQDANWVDLFVTIISVALILNGVFARCYLWFILDVNTCDNDKGDHSAAA